MARERELAAEVLPEGQKWVHDQNKVSQGFGNPSSPPMQVGVPKPQYVMQQNKENYAVEPPVYQMERRPPMAPASKPPRPSANEGGESIFALANKRVDNDLPMIPKTRNNSEQQKSMPG